MKKQKQQKLYKRPKRTTFLKLFVKSSLCGLLATGIFAGIVLELKQKDIYEQVKQELYSRTASLVSRLSDEERDVGNLNAYLGAYTYYDAVLDESYLMIDNLAQYVPEYSENCHAVSVILDEDKNILYSSQENLQSIIRTREDGLAGWYVCNLEACPEIRHKYQEFIKGKNSFHHLFSVNLHSAYVDEKNHLFVPHEAELIYETYADVDVLSEFSVSDSEKITINYENPDYELITFPERTGSGVSVPFAWQAYFRGASEEVFSEMFSQFPGNAWDIQNKTFYSSAMRGISSTARVYYSSSPVWMNGQKNYLVTAFQIDVWNRHIAGIFFRTVAVFFLITLVIAFIWSRYKNKANQVVYQYEDYQRNLINNLAHDLKTPLMAVSGYAENLLTSDISAEKSEQYLKAILENVSYTDSVISQTLELNKMQEIKALQKSLCNLNTITENAVRKYALLLEERQIAVTSEGEAEISANPETLTSAVENLISNAVRYTAVGGEINIRISEKEFRIDNTVTGKTETSALLMPFTKGDKSRTGKSGSGLGLSIADNALRANGFTLEISCTESEFTASVRF